MLHNILLKHSEKDTWHRGNYKQHSNVVEATQADGAKHIVFRTADPDFSTEDAMRDLIAWYNSDNTTPPIIRVAIFVYDFLSIHPFQDGNGRLSRLLATLLILRQGYSWIQYISFEPTPWRRCIYLGDVLSQLSLEYSTTVDGQAADQ